MSVRNLLRRQPDVNRLSPPSSSAQSQQDRPISEYDNIKPPAPLAPTTRQTHFPLAEIKFRFDDLTLTSKTTMDDSSNSSTVHYNNNGNKQTTTLPAHQYENVLDTVQMRNKRESDQQVKMNQNDEFQQRPIMSEAKSSFFGLNPDNKSSAEEEFDRLIEDITNVRIVPNTPNQYMNVIPCEETLKAPTNHEKDKISATSSASGSSSTTATPSATPTRQDRTNNSSRKNSEGSNRSKSPKFMLSEAGSPPSQSVYMSTTVPLNIKKQNITGRHKPTRQSLRHSRMIVTSKHLQGSSSSSSNALNIRHPWLARFILIFKIIIGISLLTLGSWICLYANSTPIQQNPFWAGLILILSGLLGLYLLTFRRTRSKLKANFFWFLKMNASVIVVMTVFLTTLAFIYASFHYISLTSDNKKCFPENVIINSSSCICVFNVDPNKVVTRESLVEGHTDSSGVFHEDRAETTNVVHFRDLSCNELPTWSHILLTSMVLNFIGLAISICYMTQFIFGCKKRRKRSYVTVGNPAP